MPPGCRVNCTADASARNSRCRETPALIRRAKNTPIQAQQGDAETDDQDCAATLATTTGRKAGMMTTAQDQSAHQAEYQDAEQDAHQPDVEAHVAIEYMAELVGDYALQFIAVQ